MSLINKFTIFLSILSIVDCARILGVFTTPSISHQVVLRKISGELAKRGHEVVVITTDPLNNNKNITEINTHDVAYKYWNDVFVPKISGAYETVKFFDVLYESLIEVFEIQMKVAEVQKLINSKNEKFDLIIYDALVRLSVGFSYVFKAPMIGVSTLQLTYDQCAMVGALSHPILHPNPGHLIKTDTFMDKVKEIYNHFVVTTLESKWSNDFGNPVLKKVFGENCPGIDELTDNVHMLFTNTNPMFDGNRPVPPTVINLGGIHLEPPKPLSKDLQDFLDQSKNGVVYASFGTNVAPSMFPPPLKQTILNVLSKLPYDVLLKWDKPIENVSKNIKVAQFWPQNDLLTHPKVKLFITQGGLQSTDESIVSGVPLVAIPIFGDQFMNSRFYEKYGIGIRIMMEKLSEERFEKAIYEVVGNDSYRQNIRRLAQLISDQPQQPLERAIWWAEYVIRNGGAKHLRAAGAMSSWAQFLILDVLLVLLVGGVVVFLAVYYAFKGFVGLFIGGNKRKVE